MKLVKHASPKKYKNRTAYNKNNSAKKLPPKNNSKKTTRPVHPPAIAGKINRPHTQQPPHRQKMEKI